MSLSIHGLGPTFPEHRPSEPGRRTALVPSESSESRPDDRVAPDRTDAPSDVAAGVDPRLWQLLSAEERGFYLRSAATGPLTYGPETVSRGTQSPGSRVGGRIDVRI